MVTLSRGRHAAILDAAAKDGLLANKTGRITGRVSPALVDRAKKATGIEADTALIEYALANLAVDDHFGEALVKARGTVDPALTLDF
nr:hypothetical protein [Beijerinckia sp. L45]